MLWVTECQPVPATGPRGPHAYPAADATETATPCGPIPRRTFGDGSHCGSLVLATPTRRLAQRELARRAAGSFSVEGLQLLGTETLRFHIIFIIYDSASPLNLLSPAAIIKACYACRVQVPPGHASSQSLGRFEGCTVLHCTTTNCLRQRPTTSTSGVTRNVRHAFKGTRYVR
jgi:hypothetical protein